MAPIRKLFSAFIKPSWRPGFVADERGTTAIEFAILGVPFFALLAAILETAYVFLASQILDTAVQDAGRQIRTGQIRSSATYGPDDFRVAICDGLFGLFDCDKLLINIEPVDNFNDATITNPIPTTCTVTLCEWAMDEVFDTGGTGAIVLIRVYYKWPTLVNLGGFSLADTGANARLLGSVRVFRNEPF